MSLNVYKLCFIPRLLPLLCAAAVLTITASAPAAVPGITGPTFNLVAHDGYISEPDGAMVYSWGYGCNGSPSGFAPASIGASSGAVCPTDMQIPGPTLIVHEGDSVSVTLTNSLPASAGNTSILFPGFQVTTSGGSARTY